MSTSRDAIPFGRTHRRLRAYGIARAGRGLAGYFAIVVPLAWLWTCPAAALAEGTLDASPSLPADAGPAPPEAATIEPPATAEPVAAPVADPAASGGGGHGLLADPDAVQLSAAELDALDLRDIDLKALLEMPTEVWVATKSRSTIDRVGANVTVISRDDISSWRYRSLAQVLQHLTGFYAVDDHMLPNVGVRGIPGGLYGESGSIKVMIDGYHVGFRSTGGNWLGAEAIPLASVERIEVVRGPASTLYGADAFLATVNIVTRKGSSLQGGLMEGHAGLTSKGNVADGFEAALGTRQGRLDVLVAGSFASEDRSGVEVPSTSPAPNIPSFRGADREARNLTLGSEVALGRARWKVDENHTLTFFVYLSALRRGAEFAPSLALASGIDQRGVSNQSLVSLIRGLAGASLTSKLGARTELTASASYFSGGTRSDGRLEVGSDLFYVRPDYGFQGYRLNLDASTQLPWRMSTVVGAEFDEDFERAPRGLHVLKTSSGDQLPGSVVTPSGEQSARRLRDGGVFGQLLLEPIERRLDVTLGIRYDRHNVFGSQVSGRAGAVIRLRDGLSLKLLYGSAYKAPSSLLLYRTPYYAGDIVGNAKLMPEYVHTFEGQFWYKRGTFTAATGLSYSLLRNKAEFAQVGLNPTAANIARIGSLSWETDARYAFRDVLTTFASADLTYVVRDLGLSGYQEDLFGWRGTIYPPLVLRGGVLAKIPGLPVRLVADAVFASSRRASDQNALLNHGSYDLPAYVLLNASISLGELRLIGGQRSTLWLSGTNLLGAVGPDAGFAGIDYPLALTTFLLQLRQEF